MRGAHWRIGHVLGRFVREVPPNWIRAVSVWSGPDCLVSAGWVWYRIGRSRQGKSLAFSRCRCGWLGESNRLVGGIRWALRNRPVPALQTDSASIMDFQGGASSSRRPAIPGGINLGKACAKSEAIWVESPRRVLEACSCSDETGFRPSRRADGRDYDFSAPCRIYRHGAE